MIPIAARDVAIAGRSCQRPERSRSGTTMIPPPTPKSALKNPAPIPIRTSCPTRAYSPQMVDSATPVALLAARPEAAGVLLDVDGTIAPIVDRPEDAAVPEETRSLLRDLQRRYALVACISGRTEADARRVVGVGELVYVGEHGMGFDPRAEEWGDELDQLVDDSGWEPERKQYSAAFHYRAAEDERAAV